MKKHYKLHNSKMQSNYIIKKPKNVLWITQVEYRIFFHDPCSKSSSTHFSTKSSLFFFKF